MMRSLLMWARLKARVWQTKALAILNMGSFLAPLSADINFCFSPREAVLWWMNALAGVFQSCLIHKRQNFTQLGLRMPSQHFFQTLWKQIRQTRWWKTFTCKNHLQVFGALFAEWMGRSSTEVSQKRGDVMRFDTVNERQASRSYLHIYQETWTKLWNKATKCSKQRQDTSNSVGGDRHLWRCQLMTQLIPFRAHIW